MPAAMRAGRAAVDVVPVRGVGMIGVVVHQAVGGPGAVPGNLLVIVSGYLGMLVILVVFGIWGFRLGARGSSGNPGGGGPKRPGPVTPPPGGRELGGERRPPRHEPSTFCTRRRRCHKQTKKHPWSQGAARCNVHYRRRNRVCARRCWRAGEHTGK